MAEGNSKNQKADTGKDNLTPLMLQYQEIKASYPGMILFFRLGDFYEMFNEDARKASSILELVLTQRQGVPMCGVPFHAVNSYLKKLVKVGEKVAICEQLEDPGQAKGIVKRGVVRVITPGTILEENLLASKENNYLVSVYPSPDRSRAGLACADISTGEFMASEMGLNDLKNEILKYNPREIVIPESQRSHSFFGSISAESGFALSPLEDWHFDLSEGKTRISSSFKVQSLKGFGLEDKNLAVSAVGGILGYLEKTQNKSLPLFSGIRYYTLENYLLLDQIAVKNLELVEGINTRTKENSLLEVIDFTVTSMGGRLLRNRLLRPLIDPKEITRRQEAVAFFVEEGISRRKLRELLKKIADMERIMSRIAAMNALPREILALRNSLDVIPELKKALDSSFELVKKPSVITDILAVLKENKEVKELISGTVAEEPPINSRDGGVIKEGASPELDELRSIAKNGKSLISSMEAEERKKTGISNLKIGFTSVFGYFIEVTKSNIPAVPGTYIRKQTLTNAERYITPELKTLEEKIMTAEEKIIKTEQKLFRELLEKISIHSFEIMSTAGGLAEIDFFCSLAEAAVSYNYSRPAIDSGFEFSVKEGRHPVVERKIKSGTFVSNEIFMNSDTDQIILLTGPNMAGKSTYLRQKALIAVMAQIGSFVPAAEARVGIIDRIFTRIGAGDNLSQGESTFMVEMHETANILNQFTPRSLIILDEVGRGTSTYDGISIAWAVVEYLSHNRSKEKKGPKVLFATHYFELTELEDKLAGIKNYNISVKEWQNQVIFLHKISRGAADKSYGIHVALLAGLPREVIAKAGKILLELESKAIEEDAPKEKKQLDFFYSPSSKILIELEKLDTDNLTPIQALETIDRWKKEYSVKNDNEKQGIPMAMDERRKHARLPVLHEIDTPIQVAVDKRSVPGVLVDLSANGMSLLSYALVPVGSEITLAIKLPGLSTHALKGRVVWTIQKGEMWRIGISFSAIDPLDFRHINKMAIECADCDTKIALGVKDPCFEKCSYFPLCSKPVKLKKKH